MSGIVDRLIELRDKNRSNVKDGVPVNYGERLWLRPDGRVANDAIKEITRLRAELAAKSKDAARLHRAIGIVCEGFTLPNDVRKILEKALWSDEAMGAGNE